jgi:hypothetical protein
MKRLLLGAAKYPFSREIHSTADPVLYQKVDSKKFVGIVTTRFPRAGVPS